jgi:hypothetical protein
MLLQGANEEVILTKNKMINYVRFLTEKRSSLKQPAYSKEEEKACLSKYLILIVTTIFLISHVLLIQTMTQNWNLKLLRKKLKILPLNFIFF